MKYLLPNKAYDVMKWLGLVALPAFGLFYVTVGKLWGWSAPEAVQTTCDALGVFIGALIGYSHVSATEVNDDES